MRALALALALLAGLTPAAHAFNIRGTLENGTTGAKNLSAPVIVVNPAGGMLQEQTVQAKDGRFEVTGLDDKAPIYLLRVEHDGIPYNVPVQVTGADQDVTITVYESTSSWNGIHVTVPHLAAARYGNSLRVEQLYEIHNESAPPRTATGDEGYFHLFLPADMETLMTCFVTSLGVPVDRAPTATSEKGRYRIEYPVRPGVTRIGVEYLVPYAGATYSLAEKLFHDVENLTVFGVDPTMTVSSPSHKLEQMEQVHGMSAQALVSLKKGDTLVLTFAGGAEEMPGMKEGEGGMVETADGPTEAMSEFLMLALGFVFGGLALLALRTRKDPLGNADTVRAHYDTMVARIARLDDLHAAEAIPSDAYRVAREELVARAAVLAMKLRSQGDAPAPPPEPHVLSATPAPKAR